MLIDAEAFLAFLDDLAEQQRREARSMRDSFAAEAARGQARGLKRAADELRQRIERHYSEFDRVVDFEVIR